MVNQLSTFNCRFCKASNLKQILDLGFQPPSNSLVEYSESNECEKTFPLILSICESCELLQLGNSIQSQDIFGDKYPYLSGISSTWVNHNKLFAEPARDEPDRITKSIYKTGIEYLK